MKSSSEKFLYDEQVDLVKFSKKLWGRRFLISGVTVFCACLGVLYLLLVPEKYTGEFTLRPPRDVHLAAFVPLNDVIKEHYNEFSQNSEGQFEISTDSILHKMVRELQDYTAFEMALKQHSETVQKMSEETYANARPELFPALTVKLATEKDPTVRVQLKWTDKKEILDILTSTLIYSKERVNSAQLMLLRDLADNIEHRSEAKLAEVKKEILLLKKFIDLKTQSRLFFLEEQAEIARALNLAENGLSQGAKDSQLSFNMSLERTENDFDPISESEYKMGDSTYLRGYKSLEKEAGLIAQRAADENYILNEQFLRLKRKQITLENDDAAPQFREVINTSPFEAGADFFATDRDAIRVQSMRSGSLTLALFIVLGLLASSFFVLVKDVLMVRKPSVLS